MQAKLAVLNKLLTHYGKQNWWNHSNRLVDWVSMILIQQTTQLNVERALANLEGKLSVAVLHAMEEEELQALIRPAGFYKQKSSYIKALMAWYVSMELLWTNLQLLPPMSFVWNSFLSRG